jgi:site-specific recombinase XerD
MTLSAPAPRAGADSPPGQGHAGAEAGARGRLGQALAAATAAWLAGFSSPSTRRAYAADLGIHPDAPAGRASPKPGALRAGCAWLAWLHRAGKDPLSAGPDEVREWLADQRAAGLSVATRARGLACVRSWYAHLLARKLVAESPAAALSAGQVGLHPPRQSPTLPLSAEHTAALVAAADQATGPQARRGAALVAVIFTLGLRVAEACGLGTTDLSGPRGARMLRVTGKGEHTRQLALPEVAEARLDAYLATRTGLTAVELRRRRAGPRQGRRGGDPLFATRTGAAIVPSEVFRLLRTLAIAAGLPAEIQRGISPHCARHTAAALALAAGEDIDTIRDFLGHTSIQVTQRYLHGDGTHTASRVAGVLAGRLPTP